MLLRRFKYCSLLFLFFLSGCEGIQRVQGVILDKDSKQPIENVLYTRDKIAPKTGRSGPSGEFKYESNLMALIPKPPPVTLYFYKEGYDTVKVTFGTVPGSDTVLLKKSKN